MEGGGGSSAALDAPGGGSSSSSSSAAAAGAEGAGGPATAEPAPAAADAMEEDEEEGTIDAVLQLIGGSASDGGSDVDELLGCLAPAGGQSPLLGSMASPLLGPRDDPLPDLGGGVLPAPAAHPEAGQPDLPEPTIPVPDNVKPIPFVMVAKFHLRCEVDLKQVAFGLRHAEYNPRKHTSITVRLLEPRATALVRGSGSVSISAKAMHPDLMKACAKKVARLVQKCGYQEQVKFSGYTITSILAKVDLGFPVRLEQLATRWRRNALYEPELYSGCVFKTRRPRCTYLVTAGGKVMISGLRQMEDIEEALRLFYPVAYEFQK